MSLVACFFFFSSFSLFFLSEEDVDEADSFKITTSIVPEPGGFRSSVSLFDLPQLFLAHLLDLARVSDDLVLQSLVLVFLLLLFQRRVKQPTSIHCNLDQ